MTIEINDLSVVTSNGIDPAESFSKPITVKLLSGDRLLIGGEDSETRLRVLRAIVGSMPVFSGAVQYRRKSKFVTFLELWLSHNLDESIYENVILNLQLSGIVNVGKSLCDSLLCTAGITVEGTAPLRALSSEQRRLLGVSMLTCVGDVDCLVVGRIPNLSKKTSNQMFDTLKSSLSRPKIVIVDESASWLVDIYTHEVSI